MSDHAADMTFRWRPGTQLTLPIPHLNPSHHIANSDSPVALRQRVETLELEKEAIIQSYERQLQRSLTRLAQCHKYIDVLEKRCQDADTQNHLAPPIPPSPQSSQSLPSLHSQSSSSSSNAIPKRGRSLMDAYDNPVVENLVNRVTLLHEEMINLRDLYLKKIEIIRGEHEEMDGHKTNEIIDLKTRLESYQKHVDNLEEQLNDRLGVSNGHVMRTPDLMRKYSVGIVHPGGLEQLSDQLDSKTMENQRLREIIIEMERRTSTLSQIAPGTFTIEVQADDVSDIGSDQDLDSRIRVVNEDDVFLDDEGSDDGRSYVSDEENAFLREQNLSLKKKLRRTSTQYNVAMKLLKNQHEKESLTRAQKRQRERDEKEIREQQFLMELEHVAQHKDIVIDGLADSYREMRDKAEEKQRIISELEGQLSMIRQRNAQTVERLKDDFGTKLHKYRFATQQMLNKLLTKNKQAEQRASKDVLEPDERDAMKAHLREASSVSQSADQVIPSLILLSPENSLSDLTFEVGDELMGTISMTSTAEENADSSVYMSGIGNMNDANRMRDSRAEQILNLNLEIAQLKHRLAESQSRVDELQQEITTREGTMSVPLPPRISSAEEYDAVIDDLKFELKKANTEVLKLTQKNHLLGQEMEAYKEDRRERNLLRFELESREHETKEYFDVREQHARLTLQHYAVTCELDKLREENEDLRASLYEFEALGMGSTTFYEDVARRGDSFHTFGSRSSRIGTVQDDDDDIEVDLVVGFPGFAGLSSRSGGRLYENSSSDDDEDEHPSTGGEKVRNDERKESETKSREETSVWEPASAFEASTEYDIPIQNLGGKSSEELIEIISKLRGSKFDLVKSFKSEIDRLRQALSNVTGEADPNVSVLLALSDKHNRQQSFSKTRSTSLKPKTDHKRTMSVMNTNVNSAPQLLPS